MLFRSLVGGTSEAILNEATRFLVQGYNVHVVLVPTDATTSHARSINRANLGGRLIAPYTTEGNPEIAFNETQNDLSTEKFLNKIANKKELLPEVFSSMKREKLKNNQRFLDYAKNLAKRMTFEIANA